MNKFKHEKCILLGGGNSKGEEIKNGLFEKIKDKACIISLNYAWQEMNYLPDVQIFSDQHFWSKEEQEIVIEKGQRTNVFHGKMTALRKQGVHLVYRNMGHKRIIEGAERWYATREWGVPNALYYGSCGLVGVFALSWACKNFKEIYLLGFDLTEVNGKTHSYQDVIKTSSYGVGNKELMTTYQKNLGDWKKFLDIKDVMIYNISQISKIECFTKLSWNEFYRRL